MFPRDPETGPRSAAASGIPQGLGHPPTPSGGPGTRPFITLWRCCFFFFFLFNKPKVQASAGKSLQMSWKRQGNRGSKRSLKSGSGRALLWGSVTGSSCFPRTSRKVVSQDGICPGDAAGKAAAVTAEDRAVPCAPGTERRSQSRAPGPEDVLLQVQRRPAAPRVPGRPRGEVKPRGKLSSEFRKLPHAPAWATPTPSAAATSRRDLLRCRDGGSLGAPTGPAFYSSEVAFSYGEDIVFLFFFIFYFFKDFLFIYS